MLRLFSSQCLQRLRPVVSCVTKRSFVPVLDHGSPDFLARHLNTGIPSWQDSLQPKAVAPEEVQTVDLDKWKSVMRAQAASEEKQRVSDEDEASDGADDDDETPREAAGDLLEATREMIAMWRCAGRQVPENMTEDQIRELAALPTKSSKKKLLKFLALKEKLKRKDEAKRERKKAEREALKEQRDQDGGAQKLENKMVLQYRDKSLEKMLAWRTAQSMVFGQPLVFDLSFESNMSRRELDNTVSQLMEVEGCNRRATDPFHLHFCNLQPDGIYEQKLIERYGAETWNQVLITTTDRQHVDVFPCEQLVYLTADSKNVLRKFDHSKVYIIGALVDLCCQPGLSLAKAKRLKLATARLPLDEMLNWGSGGKNMTLDQMIRIMLTLKETGNWEEALDFVPKRKHEGFFPRQMQRNMTINSARRPREEQDTGLRSGERTFKIAGLSLPMLHNQPGFSGRDRMARLPGDRENKPAAKTVRTSVKNNFQGKKDAGKTKMWRTDE